MSSREAPMPIRAVVSPNRSRAGDRSPDPHASLHAQEAALRRVTTAVAANASLEDVISVASHEAVEVLGFAAIGVLRFDGDGATAIGGRAATASLTPLVEPGRPLALSADLPEQMARVAGSPRRAFCSSASSGVAKQRYALGIRTSVAVPVMQGASAWGALVAHAVAGFDPVAREEALHEFAAVIELALANAHRLAALEAMAATDSLTGLMNHRMFFARLDTEIGRAKRYRRDLTLALIDLDDFKEINNALGHQVGDDVLVSLGTFLQSFSRSSDVVARVGGEEFAWLMPETTGREAVGAAERARAMCCEETLGPVEGLTFSVGVCDLAEAGDDSDEIYRLADTALYEAKRRGRNRIVLYRPSEVTAETVEPAGPTPFERDLRLQAIQSLARSLDGHTPGSWTHSERVADLAAKLADRLGWTAQRTASLREAALVHDIGKVGVPARMLEKRDRLDETDRSVLRTHPILGATIVEEVLSAEQTEWVRHHHECWDGTGYPDGAAGSKVPDGALILAVANAWDSIMGDRTVAETPPALEALARLVAGAGTQFATEVVDAFVELWNKNELDYGDGSPRAKRSRQAA